MTKARALYALWIAGIVALFCLHFPHLLADFPNHSPWMDYSKYTDEGWYADAAVRHFLIGHWYLHGDFNPAVALPVWPLLLAFVFHFTGVSLAAARAVIVSVLGLNLFLSYRVLRTQAPRWVALAAVTLLVSSPFLYAFSRLALQEPLVIGILLLTWIQALRLKNDAERRRPWRLIAIGLLLCLLLLTKTTGVFLLPSTLFLIGWACEFHLRSSLRALSITIAAALVPACIWYFVLVRPHYRVDFTYLFEVNRWPQPAGIPAHLAAYWWSLRGVLWISPALCILAAALLACVFVPRRRQKGKDSAASDGFWSNPLTLASLLAASGYVVFAGMQNNPQPRYYETVIYPVVFLAVLAAADLLARFQSVSLRIAACAPPAVMAALCVAGAIRIAGYVRHPEYTWLNAATQLTRYIDGHPAPNHILLSVSGDQIELTTHLPSICDDYGTWDLPYRIHAYHPSWYAGWNEMDPGTLEDLTTQYSLEQVASFPAFDDPDRNVLLLYRLHPLPPPQQRYLAKEERLDNAGK
ncbi:MAG TPA: glycosyltransferase family 39 protein [Acidobacteriaceae bacterium]|nr:glycosyltransferase family 39 protein [Acidobacteriaceae bacterium]